MKFLSLGNINFYIAIVISLINGILMCFAAYKFFQIIQLSGYKIKGYFVWLKDTKAKYVSRIILLGVLSLLCVLVTNALFNVYHEKALFSYIGLGFYFYFSIVFIVNMYQAPKKVALKYTKRMTRLNIAMLILVSVFSFFLIAISTEYLGFIRFGLLCCVPFFVPLFVPLVHLIMIPLEAGIVGKYVLKAKSKLKKYPHLIKVGITGSFGKTSTKYILNTILSEKYKVCMSPHSFNTKTGLSKVINDYLAEDDQVLIAEMGARHVGDIKELCDIVKPKYGILTGIGNQHLGTFKNIDNIIKTKKELIDSLPQEGEAIFNADCKYCSNLYEEYKNTKYLIGLNKKSSINAENVVYDENGTKFNLIINKKSYKCTTKLLGEHNVKNILLCVQMAKILKLTDEQIISGIAKLQPIPHRLEIIKTKDNIILDDSYNASVEGSSVALQVLNSIKGRKVIITPGLVELGDKEKEENINFGKKIAKVVDIVVVVNKVNFDSIKQGLDSENFDDKNIYQAESLEKAKILIKDFVCKNDVILFENDLPDNYI